MFVFLLILHILLCVILVAIILMQSGRGEGLSGTFGTGFTQTLFGTRSATFLTRATAIVGGIFLLSSLLLAFSSGYLSRSLMERQGTGQEEVKEPAKSGTREQAGQVEETPATGTEEVTKTTTTEDKE